MPASRRRRSRRWPQRNINIRAITTSEIKFSVLIDAAYTELAVRTLHTLYGLDQGLSDQLRQPRSIVRLQLSRQHRACRETLSLWQAFCLAKQASIGYTAGR